MPRTTQRESSSVACYALTAPGLEQLAAKEIEHSLGGEVRRVAPGLVVFRVAAPDPQVLRLRTVEDVYLLLWGTDSLTHRAQDLKQITAWTANEPDWPRMLQLHHAIHAKPSGKPTYRLVAQMKGEQAYRRVDALKAMARGLQGKFPTSWKPAEENAAIEVWLTISDTSAVCGLRLSDWSMRHRTYKREHMPASLRPIVAAALVQLADVQPGQRVLDPMCGVGTILAECLALGKRCTILGGDIEPSSLRAADVNLRKLGNVQLFRWDALQIPLPDHSIDRIVSNPPFGKQLGEPEHIGALYEAMIQEADRVLKANGRAAYLVMDASALEAAARKANWHRIEKLRVRVLGQPAMILVFRKRTK